MSVYQVQVSCGRQKVTINVSPTDEIRTLRENVERELGFVQSGVRLIFKGKSLQDELSIETCGLNHGSKLIAIRTAKQVGVDNEKQKYSRLKDSLQPRQASASTSSRTSSDENKSVPEILGDEAVEGQFHVFVKKGRTKYRVNAAKTASLVKDRMSNMLSISAKDVRLLGGGKFLHGDDEIKHGMTLMMLFSAKHHDRIEKGIELNKLVEETDDLERQILSLKKQAAHRLKDKDELMFELSHINEAKKRISDNLNLIEVNSTSKTQLRKRLDNLDTNLY